MASYHAAQPPSLLRDWLVPASLELILDLFQLRPHPLRYRDAPQPEPPAPGLPANVVAVGTALAGGPPHRSRRAELPHRAPASGSGGEAHLRVGMPHTGSW
jgi:hypothetical protein